MEAAAMGRFSESAPPSSGGGKLGALMGVGKAIGGMMGGDATAAPTSNPMGADGSQKLLPETGAAVDDAMASRDKAMDDEDERNPLTSGRYKFL